MFNIKKIAGYIAILLTFSSCGISKGLFSNDKSGFTMLTSANELNGSFLNFQDIKEYNTLLWICNIYKKKVKTVHVSMEDSTLLKIEFETDSMHFIEKFKGKMNDHFFEVYLKNKKVFIPLIYSKFDVERIRFGLTVNGELMVRGLKYAALYYTPFLGGDTANGEKTYIYKKSDN